MFGFGLGTLKRWAAGLVAILAAIGAGVGLKWRGDKYRAQAQREADRADINQEIIDDIHQVNVAQRDADTRERVREQYRRD